MAPLYNRYIPPKPSTGSAGPIIHEPSLEPPVPTPYTDKKRKRERSETEQAERKAKKLRKKGVEDAAEVVSAEVGSAHAVELPLALPQVDDAITVPEQAETAPQSEFAHVKSAKKRHKLEKEARKARKQAEKTEDGGQGEAGVSDGVVGPGELDHRVEDEPTEITALPNDKHEGEHLAFVATSDEQDVAVKKEEKKRKKRRKQEEREEETVEDVKEDLITGPLGKSIQDSALTEDTNMPDAAEAVEIEIPSTAADLPKPKKRRHKLESALQPPQEDAQDEAAAEDSDEHLKNHSSVISKFQKAKELAEKKAQQQDGKESTTPETHVEKRDLAPFPQPVNEPENSKSTFSALPSWITEPTVVSNDSKRSFAKLQLPTATVQQVEKLGFQDALPVQQALIPLLLPPGTSGSAFLPGTESILPDVAVSAATGSGKTIGYLLPTIETLKRRSFPSCRLRSLVVVPTRELVTQVAAVAESLTKGSALKVGTASGVGKFRDEQQRLVKAGRRYDPIAYAEIMAKAHRRNHPLAEDSEDFEKYVKELEQWDEHQEQELQDALEDLIDHVPTYSSAVDILVCTPGRLLEHLSSTLGFELTHVEWLVLDEADKLLDQQYDGFLQRLHEALSRERAESEQDAREKSMRTSGLWDEQYERRVRKVVLSATMTRDISKLIALKLRRPKMVVLQGAELDISGGAEGTENVEDNGGVFELPSTLNEFYVPIGDGSEKPLYLLELLKTRVLADAPDTKVNGISKSERDEDDSSSEDSSSQSSTDSDSGSGSSTSSSESDSSSDDSSSESDSASDTSDTDIKHSFAALSARKPTSSTAATAPTVLIFTSSTESATRLSHLISVLEPSYKSHITTLTKTTSRQNPFPRNPSASDPVITIATDRAGRGLDTLANRRITHVLQYDVPRSVTGYVHRVGRTARAGEGGEAWTLYSEREARWFVHEIVRAENLRRPQAVERVRIEICDDGIKDRFAQALAGMRDVVFGGGSKAGR